MDDMSSKRTIGFAIFRHIMTQIDAAKTAPAIKLDVGESVWSRPGETFNSRTKWARNRGCKDCVKISNTYTDGRAGWLPFFAVPQNDAELHHQGYC